MMLSKAGERGAVNILFLVFVLVIALAFAGLWFTQMQENETLKSEATLATAEVDLARAQMDYVQTWYREWAPMVGTEVPSEIVVPENPNALDASEGARAKGQEVAQKIQTKIREVGPRVGDASAGSTPTLTEVIEVPIVVVETLRSKLKTAEDTIKSLEADVSAKDDIIAQTNAAHAQAMSTAQEEASANESRLNAQVSRLSEESDANSAALRDTQDKLESARQEHQEERSRLTAEVRERDSGLKALKSERRLERERQGADGKVLGMDGSTGLVFINLTSKDQLHRGTRFRVYGVGKGGEKIAKGYITVTDVQPTMSTARVDSPVAGMTVEKGDMIINPVFNKERPVNFVFLGELPGRYSREMAISILRRNGANVQDETMTDTDFLVLGQNESEEDLPLEETDSYRNANKWGIHIITEKDLAPFLRQ